MGNAQCDHYVGHGLSGHVCHGKYCKIVGLGLATPDDSHPKADPEASFGVCFKAYKVLSRLDYLLPAVDIPYCHHEKWDGTGYPRKLKGEEIPLPARIFAVLDVYDALTSDRPYRKAWEKEKALAYIREQSGKHFFPEAVKAFCEMVG